MANRNGDREIEREKNSGIFTAINKFNAYEKTCAFFFLL